MANQSAPIQEVSRLLDLVPFLSTHSHISLKELALEFDISEKAMASELTALSMCGLPGYTPYELIEIFFDSGFVTINNHETLDIPRALTQLEAASLLIGLEILRDAVVDQELALVEKIDSLVREMKELLGHAISVDQNPITGFQSTIERAIAGRKSISLHYRSPVKDETTEREVDPLSLQSEGGHLYLIAYCHSAHAVRNFRLDRVVEVKESGTTFDSINARSAEDAGDEEPLATLRMRVSGERRTIAEALSLSEIGEDGLISKDVFSIEWITKAVIAHAPHLELLDLGEVRKSVKSEAEKILALYSS